MPLNSVQFWLNEPASHEEGMVYAPAEWRGRKLLVLFHGHNAENTFARRRALVNLKENCCR